MSIDKPTPEPQRTSEWEFESFTWGEGHPTKENYSVGFCCDNSECKLNGKFYHTLEDFKKIGIGVKNPPFQSEKYLYNCALMCECPECFSKFWFHISDSTARTLKKIVMDKKG